MLPFILLLTLTSLGFYAAAAHAGRSMPVRAVCALLAPVLLAGVHWFLQDTFELEATVWLILLEAAIALIGGFVTYCALSRDARR